VVPKQSRVTSTNTVPIIVERATYWSTATQFWAAGASTLLTKLQ
jgi:hypothetical protein